MSPSIPVEFGIAVELLGYLNVPIDPPMLNSMRFAAYAGTLTILRSEKGDPVGFVCWAGGNKESVRIADGFNLLPSRLWEYKEGNIALILFVNFAYPFNAQAKVAFKKFMASHRAAYYVRRERKRLIVRTSKGFRTGRLVHRTA